MLQTLGAHGSRFSVECLRLMGVCQFLRGGLSPLRTPKALQTLPQRSHNPTKRRRSVADVAPPPPPLPSHPLP